MQNLGIGPVIRIIQWVAPKLDDQLIVEDQAVPFHAKYACEVWVAAAIHRIEVHVYFEYPGAVLHRNWNIMGAYESNQLVAVM